MTFFTQNITNKNENVSVYRHTLIQFTCQSDSGVIVWRSSSDNTFVNKLGQRITLGSFSILVVNVSGSNITATANIEVTDNVTLTCADDLNNGSSSTLLVNIKHTQGIIIVKRCYCNTLYSYTSTKYHRGF